MMCPEMQKRNEKRLSVQQQGRCVQNDYDSVLRGVERMKLYFGNAITTATTLMILALLGFIGWSLFNRVNISCWGRRSAAVLIFGLVVCCFAAARDGLDKTIQNAIDGSCAPGLVPVGQHSHHRWLRWRTADHHCCHCHADRKDAKDA